MKDQGCIKKLRAFFYASSMVCLQPAPGFKKLSVCIDCKEPAFLCMLAPTYGDWIADICS